MSELRGLWKHKNSQHARVPPRWNVASQVAFELKTATYATPPMEEREKKVGGGGGGILPTFPKRLPWVNNCLAFKHTLFSQGREHNNNKNNNNNKPGLFHLSVETQGPMIDAQWPSGTYSTLFSPTQQRTILCVSSCSSHWPYKRQRQSHRCDTSMFWFVRATFLPASDWIRVHSLSTD